MKPRHLISLSVTAMLPSLLPARSAEVLPPQRREPVVEQAQALAAPAGSPELPPDLRNPFVAAAPIVAAPAAGGPARAVATADRDLLERLAPLVDPSGTMHLNGQPILLFGQKRIKVGDPLPITFDGQPYVLVISAIQRTSFTLRLNGEEITRPIKPSNRP